MKRTLICAAMSLSLVALPLVSEARDDGSHGGRGDRGGHSHSYRGDNGRYGDYRNDDHGGRGDYRGDDDHRGREYRGGDNDYHGGDFGRVAALPFWLGAAAIGAVVTIATAPFHAAYAAPPPPRAYYGNSQPADDYRYEDRYGYAPAPYGYVAPPQTCTYYSDGSSDCR